MCSVSSVVLDMDIVRKIVACETVAKLTLLESLYVLNEYEQGLVYERKVEIVTRLLKWGIIFCFSTYDRAHFSLN